MHIFSNSWIIPRYSFKCIFSKSPATDRLAFCSFFQFSKHVTKPLTLPFNLYRYTFQFISFSWQMGHKMYWSKLCPMEGFLFFTVFLGHPKLDCHSCSILTGNIISWITICSLGLNHFFPLSIGHRELFIRIKVWSECERHRHTVRNTFRIYLNLNFYMPFPLNEGMFSSLHLWFGGLDTAVEDEQLTWLWVSCGQV